MCFCNTLQLRRSARVYLCVIVGTNSAAVDDQAVRSYNCNTVYAFGVVFIEVWGRQPSLACFYIIQSRVWLYRWFPSLNQRTNVTPLLDWTYRWCGCVVTCLTLDILFGGDVVFCFHYCSFICCQTVLHLTTIAHHVLNGRNHAAGPLHGQRVRLYYSALRFKLQSGVWSSVK